MFIMTRKELEEQYGETWTTDELREEFTVKGFSMCICVVERKSDGKVGSLDFTRTDDEGRCYYDFVAD
jgi:hypothetical protein